MALTVLGLAVLGFVGCDGDAIPLEDLTANIETAQCDFSTTCGIAPDRSTCAASLSVAETNIQPFIDAVRRGTLAYDGALARQCLSALGRTCLQGLGAPPACDQAFRGKVAAGGVCRISNECISGACNGSCADACCIGSCADGEARVVVGGACTILVSCVRGAYCSGGQCVADLPLGTLCTAVDTCRSPGQCSVTVLGATGTCVTTRVPEGAPCDPAGPSCFRIDDYCAPDTLTCLKRRPVGSPCVSDECVRYARCLNGVCTAAPALGQACDPAGALCFGRLVCSPGGVCAAPPPTPNACTP